MKHTALWSGALLARHFLHTLGSVITKDSLAIQFMPLESCFFFFFFQNKNVVLLMEGFVKGKGNNIY